MNLDVSAREPGEAISIHQGIFGSAGFPFADASAAAWVAAAFLSRFGLAYSAAAFCGSGQSHESVRKLGTGCHGLPFILRLPIGLRAQA